MNQANKERAKIFLFLLYGFVVYFIFRSMSLRDTLSSTPEIYKIMLDMIMTITAVFILYAVIDQTKRAYRWIKLYTNKK